LHLHQPSDPDLDFLPIPDAGSNGQKGTGSRILFRNTAEKYMNHILVSYFVFCLKAEKYGLDQIFYNSFNCSFGFRHRFCAADIVRVGLSEHQGYCRGGE
jgi:hypothetical protein